VAISDDLLAPGVVSDPHPYFHRLRAEDPVHWNEMHRSWLLTRYDDVESAFRDRRLSADRILPHVEAKLDETERATMEPALRVLSGWMVFRDPPEHTRLRRVVLRAFPAARAGALRPRIRAIVDELLEPIRAAGATELVQDFAFPLPATVIAELLGVPASDRDLFHAWSVEIAGLVFGNIADQSRYERARKGLVELADYFRALIRDFASRPGDNLISALVAASKDDRLSDDELVSTCTLLLFAGHETTTGLIANGSLALLENPDELDRLRRDPSLAATAVEEVLRYEGPAKLAVRRAGADVELRGKRIRAGARVMLVQTAANRDPERFPEPDRLDLSRADNPHLAFAQGLHFCLGATLARVEAHVAFVALAKLPGLRLAEPDRPLAWSGAILGRAVSALPLAFDA
jgi:cytochrome P450